MSVSEVLTPSPASRSSTPREPGSVCLGDWKVPAPDGWVSTDPTRKLGRAVEGARAQRRARTILALGAASGVLAACFAGFALGATGPTVAFVFIAGGVVGCLAGRRWSIADERQLETCGTGDSAADTYATRGPGRELFEQSTVFFAVPLLLILVRVRPTPWFGDWMGVAMTLALIAVSTTALLRMWSLLGTGSMRVAYPDGHLAPGRVATVRIGLSEHAAPLERLCLRVVAFVERPWNGPYAAMVAFLQVDARWEVSDRSELPAAGGDVELELALPPGPPTQRTSGHRVYQELGSRVYWELEVYARSTAGRYVRRFPLPVYAEDASSGRSPSSEGPGGDA